MQLNDYHDYLTHWMYVERYVNDGSDHRFRFQSEVPYRYRPKSNVATFPIYTLISKFSKAEHLLPEDFYPVHPFTARLYRDSGHMVVKSPYRGIPTASTRTMLISNNDFKDCLFVKLDLPVVISRFNRAISKSDVEFSSQVNHELANLKLPVGAACGTLPEVGGGYTKLNDGRESGYLVRELQPHWFAQKPRRYYLLPAFSLTSSDPGEPEHIPFLVQILKRSPHPAEVLLKKIIIPLLDYWFLLAERGILWELQQQNTLFVIDHNYQPLGVVSRDYDAIYIDEAQRAAAGLANGFIKHTLHNDWERRRRYSLTFDHRLCKQNILRIITCCQERYGVKFTERLKSDVKNYIHQTMPANVRQALPEKYWFTCPETMFTKGIEMVQVAHPPLR